jgi:general secretion pathway protein D
MKPSKTILFTLGLSAGLPMLAAAQPAGAPTNPPSAGAATNPPVTEQSAPAVVPAVAQAGLSNAVVPVGLTLATNAPEASVLEMTSTNGLRLNIVNAPLSLVLQHLVKAAGFIVNGTTQVRGNITVLSDGPVTKDEAVALLNSELKKNGYAIVRNNRILTIVELGSVKTANLDICTPYNPDEIEASDEVITALIHIRYANAPQLLSNLEILLPTSATLSANESANTLIMVATKTDIKRMLKIINALDSSIANVSSIKVVRLSYADAKETANIITQLFGTQNNTQGGGNFPGSSGRSSMFLSMLSRFGGRGGPGGPGGSGGNPTASAKVVAVADDRSNAVVVSAPDDLLTTICETITQIDKEVTDEVELRRFRLTYADPQEIADQLSVLFPDPTTGSSGSSQSSSMPSWFRGFNRGGSSSRTSSSSTSDHAKKLGRVTAVPDPRTQSLLVTASKSMMPEIADMITSLDGDPGKREVVKVFELQNADPQDVNTVLQDLFNRNTRMNNVNNNQSLLGNRNPLTQRSTQNIQNNSSGFGNAASGRAGSGGGY